MASPLSTIACSVLARHSSVCCPIPAQPGHPAVRPYLSNMFCRTFTTRQLVLLLDCWSLLRAPCCRISRTANTQSQELQIPSTITFKHYHLQDASHNVFSLLLFASTARIHRCGQACRPKTPRIHRMFNLAPSSEWFRPKHTSPIGTTSPV